jgi:uncharacterized protein YkwD
MRCWNLVALCAGCVMYQAPGSPPGATAGEPGEPGPPSAPGPSAPDERAGPPGAASTAGPPGAASTADPPPDPAFSAPGRRKPERRPASEAEALVDAHNRVRARHCAAPLTWSPKLAQVAQQWASALRDKGCVFGHSSGSYGENLAAGTSGVLDAEAVVKMWYDEVAHYKFPGGGFSAQTGHFTQVVWRGTTHVGCGRSQCKGMDIWVCEYDPAGNWEGQYRQNVLPAGCKQ